MANSDKDILITPNIGQTNEPQIEFTGADNNTVTMRVLDDGTLSWSGSAGELFSISDSLTGTLFSVNDISGVPSLEVNSNGTVTIAEFSGNVLVGTATDNGTDKLQVNGSIGATDLVLSGNLTIGGTTTTVNTADLAITDNIIVLNNGETGAGVTLGTAGIEIERGTASNVSLLFDESTDEWKLTKDGTNYYNILNKSDTAYTGFTNYLRSDADDTASGVITFTDYVHMTATGYALYLHTDASERSLITVSEAANGSVGSETWYLGHGSDNDIFWYSYSKADRVITLAQNGKIGIGTNEPAYELDVNGISHTRSYFQKEYNSQEILLRAQDSAGQWSIYHTINDSQGNYNIMLGVNGAGQYANTNDGAAKVYLTGHGTAGYTSINAANTGTSGNLVSYNIGLGVDSATAAVYVGNPGDNAGLDATSDGYKIASNSGQIFGTDILGNVSYSSGGQIALSRSNNNPYLSFHDAGGNRDGYIQSISTTNMIIQHAGDIRLASNRVTTDSDIQATGIAVDAVVTVENWSGGNNTVGSAHNLGTWSLSGGTYEAPGTNYYGVDIANLPNGLGYQIWVGGGTSTLTSPTINLAKYRPMTTGSQYSTSVDDAFSDAKLFLTCWVAVQSMDDAAEYMAIEVKSDANTTWTEKARLSEDNDVESTNVTDTTWHKMTIDITNFAETNFQVRFVGTGGGTGDGYGVSSIYIHQATLPSKLSLRELTVNQKVGIGNDNPLQTLSISGRANADQNNDYYGAWFDGNTATGGYNYFAVGEWYSSSTYFQKKQGQSYSHLYTYNSGHSIAIQAGSDANGETAASGNVGIGKTDPSTKLHVFEDNMVGPDPVVKVDASYLTDTVYTGHGSVMQLTTDRGDGFADGYLLDVQNSTGTALKIRGDRITSLRPGTSDYLGNQAGIVGKTLQIHSEYDDAGSQWNAFGYLNGNWLDGSSGVDSQYGLIFGFQSNVRGGLIYDHRSTERMAMWSSYGRMDFMIASSTDGNGVPIDSNISEAMTIAVGGNVGIGTTVPHDVLTVTVNNGPATSSIYRSGSNIGTNTTVGVLSFDTDYNSSETNYGNITVHSNDLSAVRASMDLNIKSTTGSMLTGMTLYGTNDGVNVGIGVTDPSSKFEVHGTAGQLFSVTDDLTGTIFAVNDVSGIPSIEVEDDGTVKLAEFGGNVLLGTGTDNGSDLLQVDGGILATGDVTAYGSSDARLKTNLEPIANAVDKVNTLTGYTFNWNDQAVGKDTTVREAGIIAQDVDAVLPEVVTTRKDGYMAVKYEKIVPLLIEAIKEQDDKIKRLEALVEKLLDEK